MRIRNSYLEANFSSIDKLLIVFLAHRYTLRNAEYRLCLERSLGAREELPDSQRPENVGDDDQITAPDGTLTTVKISGENELRNSEKNEEESVFSGVGVEGLGEMTPEAQEYILCMQSRLSSMEKVK